MFSQITNSFAIKWPQDLVQLRLFPYEKASINEFLKYFIPHYLIQQNFPSTVNEGTSFSYQEDERILHRKLTFIYGPNKEINHILISLGPNFIIGKGCDRDVVKKCYDLVKGKFMVDKFVHQKEKTILETLQEKEGIPRVYGFYSLDETNTDGVKVEKLYVIEKFYEHLDLAHLLENHLLTNPMHVLSIMHNLLSGLSALHNISVVHFDLKPENILITKFKAVLSDYGNANCLDIVKGGPLYYPPEYFDMERKYPTTQTRKEHNTKFGKARDIWALGIIFGYLLKNSYSRNGHTFNFLREAFGPALVKTSNESVLMYKKVFHSTDKLQIDLLNLKNSINDLYLLNALQLTEKMLRFDPEQRPTASQLLEEFNPILKIASMHPL